MLPRHWPRIWDLESKLWISVWLQHRICYGVLGATHSQSVSVTIVPSTHSTLSGASEDTPVTAVQHFLQATSLSDDSLRSEESLTEDIELPTPPPSSTIPSSVESGQLWKDIDQAEANDPLFSAEYTPEIFRYMREREVSNPCVHRSMCFHAVW